MYRFWFGKNKWVFKTNFPKLNVIRQAPLEEPGRYSSERRTTSDSEINDGPTESKENEAESELEALRRENSALRACLAIDHRLIDSLPALCIECGCSWPSADVLRAAAMQVESYS